nr:MULTISPECIES: hypothetical protein [unclassified Paenibacillus]
MNSLARSQRALARILESVADVTVKTRAAEQRLVEQIEAISRYQRQIAVKMIGIKIRRKRVGAPKKPWVNITLVHDCHRPGSQQEKCNKTDNRP